MPRAKRAQRSDDQDEIPGGDSFLDITANIVGILVLLVVVVGVRAGREVFMPEPVETVDASESLAAILEELKATTARAGLDRQEAIELRENILATVLEAERRAKERAEATLYVTTLRAELDEARDDLTEDDRRSLDAHNALAQAQLKLDQLARQQIGLSAYEPEPDVETVTVAPTPIVDGQADLTVSFRLQGDRLVYVPVNEIEIDLKNKIKAPAISDPSKPVTTTERLGPIDGFAGEAKIDWAVRVSGNRVGVLPRLNKLILREVTPLRGEDPDQAFGPGGYVTSRLELLDPADFVVRLIVYADSFDTAPDVGQRFRDRGFRVAQSLKSNGSSIGFSSDGYQAVTQ